MTFFSQNISTIIGDMIAIADDRFLYILEFLDNKLLERKMRDIKISTGTSDPLTSIQSELKSYFEGTLNKFKTPIHMQGSSFQKLAWKELLNIPYGETRSYLEEATNIGKPSSYRAVANANGANRLAIIIPCHRIINNNGEIGGYGGGLPRKKWLLDHEKKYR